MSAHGALETDRAIEQAGMLPWWLVLMEGVAAIIIGILLFLAPQATLELVIQLFGLFWLVGGILRVAHTFTDPTDRGLQLVMGGAGILAGFVVIRHPLLLAVTMTSMLVLLLGGAGVVIGVISLYLAFHGRGWGAAVLGVLSLLFALLVLVNPFVTNPAWVYLYAVVCLVGGLVAVVLAFRKRKPSTPAASPAGQVGAAQPAQPGTT
jgi:uncharacterized membrane protein HdeD (DUF308 family)